MQIDDFSTRFLYHPAVRAAAVAVIALGTRADAATLLVSDVNNHVIRGYNPTTGVFTGNFTSGATLSSPYDMTVGPDNNLYVADFNLNSVLKFNGTTGAFISNFATATAPYGVKFGPNGNLFVGVSGGAVQQFNGTTGAALGTFVPAPASGDFGGMAFSNGSLFVTYLGTASGQGALYRYNAATGAAVGANGGKLYDQFAQGNGPRSPAVGPDGDVFVPVWQSRTVVRFDAAAGYALQGNAVNDVSISPYALLFDSVGLLDVLDTATSSVRRYDPTTGAYFGNLVSPGGGGLGFGTSIVLIPEPSALALVGVAGVMLRRTRRAAR